MENLHLYLILFFMGTFKFMFAPLPGIYAGLPSQDIFILVTSGGLASFNVFYFLANYFITQSIEKKKRLAKKPGYTPPKVFTKTNKSIVKLKMTKWGYWLITILAPIVLSIPIGSIVVAKFYRHHKETYWITSISIIVFGALFTAIPLYLKT